ncbi:hypothetical protein, partial [Bradyrhizobium ottawaense]|uniref:hypothetical protein n=1 Tax=Bradyrhizobium ottawaense TaxID=931866 RepID=UPI0030C73E59
MSAVARGMHAHGAAARHVLSEPAPKESQLRAIALKTKMARVMRAIFVSDPVKSEFGCGEAQPPI